ncbi:S9 family peptidase [Tepidiforma sp.]|uniref:S9 family peptidase n=1 Tax=Tepidiforma sp. TaxID=2682230 RepID=UPI00261544CA|nr:S9 family peptidase [Tepidiforma sp.]MCX7618102.1 S9 family peptidase [Tepidiforma sp.]
MTSPRRLTIADLARFPRPGLNVPGGLGFTPDGRAVTYLHSAEGNLVRSLWQLDLETGERRVIAGPPPATTSEQQLSREEELRRERARLRELGVTSYEFAVRAPVPTLLVPGGGRLWLRVGDGGLEPVPGSEGAIDPHLSPAGDRIAFVRDGDLYVLPAAGGEPRRLTHDAEDGLTNGLAEFIAQEELERDRGFWWSPDGDRIAFIRADSRHIPEYPIVHQGKADIDIERHRYPFAGQPNAILDLGIVRLDDGRVEWLDLGPDRDLYIAHVGWRPDGALAVQVLSRDQRTLRIVVFEPGRPGRVLLEEHQEPWINLAGETIFLADGRILWSSERSGFRHLYLLSPDGALERQLTSGEWMVTSVLGVDEARGLAYFAATRESPLERHLYRVPLAGGEPERLTPEHGWHAGVLAPGGAWLLDSWSSREHPPCVVARDLLDGRVVPVHEPEPVDAPSLGLAIPEFHEVAAPDGTLLYGALYRPAPSDRPAPVVVSVYGGPHVQRVVDDWTLTVDLRAQYLAQQGIAVFKLDNRGSSGRGLAFEAHIARRMGTVEVEDQVGGVRYLAGLPGLDTSRVGIYGWSYGGYMTLMCLLKAQEVFRVGVAGAPVTDWDGYDTGYTERYMGTPAENPDGYREASALVHAHRLEGRLLLVHGMTDENVHFRHTARFIVALTEAGKPYDLLIFPEERHMPRDQRGLEYQEERVIRFLLDNL